MTVSGIAAELENLGVHSESISLWFHHSSTVSLRDRSTPWPTGTTSFSLAMGNPGTLRLIPLSLDVHGV